MRLTTRYYFFSTLVCSLYSAPLSVGYILVFHHCGDGGGLQAPTLVDIMLWCDGGLYCGPEPPIKSMRSEILVSASFLPSHNPAVAGCVCAALAALAPPACNNISQ